jgi:porin
MQNSKTKLIPRYGRSLRVLSLILPLMLIVPTWAQIQAPALDTDGPQLDNPARQYLLGDWGGARSSLAEKGILFDFFYINDSQGNPIGGLQQSGATWNRVRGTIDIDFDHFTGEKWHGLRFHATGLWQTGSNLGQRIGTLANPSDLVSANAARLDSFWLEQLFSQNKLRIRVGQLAGFDFYGNQEYGGSWLIEPLGYAFGNLFSTVYDSFNPAGTPGAEVRFAPKPNFYVKTAVISANRDPYHQDPTGFEFKIRNTPDYQFEAGYVVSPEDGMPSEADVGYITKSAGSTDRKSYPGLYKFGGVFNRGQFSDPARHTSHGNYLIYGMASQALFRTEAGSNRGLDATFGFDRSPDDVSRQNVQITAGARFNAPFRARKSDRLAFGFVYSKISDPFSGFGQLLGAARLGSEKALEWNYSIQVRPYLLLEPTFQYYVNVGGNPLLSNPAVFGLRTRITL